MAAKITQKVLDEIDEDFRKIEALRPGVMVREVGTGRLGEVTSNDILDDARTQIGSLWVKWAPLDPQGTDGGLFQIRPWEVEILDPLTALGEQAPSETNNSLPCVTGEQGK